MRTTDSDYVCWLKLCLQFYEVNGSKWAWFELICLLYCLLHFKILIKTTFRDDQLKGIYLQIISTIKSTITRETILLCLQSEGYVEPLPDVTERSEDYVILPKEEFHPKRYKNPSTGAKIEEPNYWYLDQMKEVIGERD